MCGSYLVGKKPKDPSVLGFFAWVVAVIAIPPLLVFLWFEATR
jgi:hypothetical protein